MTDSRALRLCGSGAASILTSCITSECAFIRFFESSAWGLERGCGHFARLELYEATDVTLQRLYARFMRVPALERRCDSPMVTTHLVA
jgi:hypothetical protein